MRISKVEIFKVPFDNSYTNVIDILDYGGLDKTKSRMYDTINLFYGATKKSYDGIARAIKRVGNSTLLVLPLVYEEAREYNYMIIKDTDDNYYFYFITEVMSENDSTSNPSSLFSLEWDVWCNNIENFKDVDNNITQKHYDRFKPVFDAENITFRGFEPIYRVNNININLPKHSKSLSFDRYIPAFFVLTLKENNQVPMAPDKINTKIPLYFQIPTIYYYGIGNSSPQTMDIAICDSVNNRYNRNVVYIFAGIFDQDEEHFIPSKVSGLIDPINVVTVDNEEYDMFYDPSRINSYGYLSPYPSLNLPDTITPFIDNITLSFHSPFIYTINTDTYDPMEIHFNDNAVFYWNYGQKQIGGWNPHIIVGDFIHNRGLGITEEKRYRASFPTRNYDIQFNDVNGYYNILRDKVNFKKDLDLIDPIAYTPPFCDVFISYNNEYKRLFIADNNKQLFKITITTDTPQPKFNIKSGGSLVSSPYDLFVKNSGFFSFGVDSLQNFLLKNGQSLNQTVVKNLVTGVIGVVSAVYGNASGIPIAVSSFNNIVGTAVSVNQAERTPDEWFTNSGECDLKYQDRIKIVVDSIERNNIVFREYMKNVYLNGYEFPSIDSPFKNSRITFDYVKTTNCDLSPLKININDTKKLEEIFNRGVTKWHMWAKNGIIQFAKDMIKDKENYTNYEIITESNDKINEWLYS